MAKRTATDMSANTDEIKIVGEVQTDAAVLEQTEAGEEAAPVKKAAPKAARSKKYQKHRAQVDKTREYDPFAAVEMIKRLSYSSFPGTISVDMLVKEIGDQGPLTFPNSTGKSVRVAIASDELIAELEAGTVEFDVLLSTPAFMPKLSKFARTLGPRGMMPNPKNGTLTAKPELKKKELEKGTFTVKTERKQPVVHLVLGKQDMETKALVENLQALLKTMRGKTEKVFLSATMSPSVKVKVE
jgi:large subunit ribosomal protein L1